MAPESIGCVSCVVRLRLFAAKQISYSLPPCCLILFLIYLFVFIVFTLPSETDAKTTLVLHHFVPDTHSPHKNMLVPWAKAVEQLSEGKVKIVIAPGMELGGRPKDLMKQASEGKVDLVWTVNGYSGTTFIRSEVFELPFVHINDPVATNLAMRELFESDLKQDYEEQGVEVMFLHVTRGHALLTKGYAPLSPQDLRRKRIRVPVRTMQWAVEELQGSAVKVPVPRIPQVLQRNVADTLMIPMDVVEVLGLERHISHFTQGPQGERFANTVFQVSMNKARWDSLDGDIQEAFRKASGPDFLKKVGQQWSDDDQAGEERLILFKRTKVDLTSAQLMDYQKALKPVEERWLKQVSFLGIDGKKLIDKARKTIKKHLK